MRPRAAATTILAVLSLGITQAALAKPVTADIAPAVVSADALPKLKLGFPGGVSAIPDVTYSSLNGFRPLTLDLYVPLAKGGPKPLVIYIHGGGWSGGTSRNAAAFSNFPAVLADLASRGYVVASLNYRLSGEAKFPAAADDVDAAIRWLKAHAADYGIDKTRVGLWGGSAGGQLAGLAATDCSAAKAGGESDCVQAAVIWYGIFDFSTMNAPPAYLGCNGPTCAAVGPASAIVHVSGATPPMLLIHGTADKTVPYAQSVAMLAKLKATGVPAQLIEMPDYDHSFIGPDAKATHDGHLKVLQATFDFFDERLKAK